MRHNRLATLFYFIYFILFVKGCVALTYDRVLRLFLATLLNFIALPSSLPFFFLSSIFLPSFIFALMLEFSFIHSFVLSFIRSFVHSFVVWFVRSFVRLFIRLFLHIHYTKKLRILNILNFFVYSSYISAMRARIPYIDYTKKLSIFNILTYFYVMHVPMAYYKSNGTLGRHIYAHPICCTKATHL